MAVLFLAYASTKCRINEMNPTIINKMIATNIKPDNASPIRIIGKKTIAKITLVAPQASLKAI